MRSVIMLYRFAATDAKGGVASSANIVINMCNCSGHGECVFSELREAEKTSAMFRLAPQVGQVRSVIV